MGHNRSTSTNKILQMLYMSLKTAYKVIVFDRRSCYVLRYLWIVNISRMFWIDFWKKKNCILLFLFVAMHTSIHISGNPKKCEIYTETTLNKYLKYFFCVSVYFYLFKIFIATPPDISFSEKICAKANKRQKVKETEKIKTE